MELFVYLLGMLHFCQASVTEMSSFRGFSKEIMNDPEIMEYPIQFESPLNLTLFECAILMNKKRTDLAPLGTSQEDDRCEIRKFPPLLLKPVKAGPFSVKFLFVDKSPYVLDKTLWEKLIFVLFLDESKKFFKDQYLGFTKGAEAVLPGQSYDGMIFSEKSPFPGPFGTLAWNVDASTLKTIQVQSTETKKFTLLFWYKLDLEPTERHRIMSNDKIVFFATNAPSQNHPICQYQNMLFDVSSTTTLPIQSWAHIAIAGEWSAENVTTTITYYLNGVKTGDTSLSGFDATIGTNELVVGDTSIKGHLSSLMFFGEALPAEDIVDLMNLKRF
ncbi:hypothetical protein TCAL_11355 [Tigriopus californicus]|uniref:LamG-like jellyroll fold domain-containing protein n=2 Tax=Tigriopus californicus TaxID=6832 RepID=A0A553PG26_TIGCA|nr:hypothetical protein TCAL_11355 [Tigriopus californicus]|eukprot:TCALIF_11355-PA protein Name:"Protein of unknown function" AED:0.00 eAED:0.00 QI:16/1/1/1/0/0.2/5/205/329